MNTITFTVLVILGFPIMIPVGKIFSMTIDKSYYQDKFIKYESQHEIVQIIPSINFTQCKASSPESIASLPITAYFVEADSTTEGKYIDQGVYIYKDGNVSMLLHHGRDIAATENNPSIFIGTKNGIYILKNDVIEKYGSTNDSIMKIDVDVSSDTLYILTKDLEIYKVFNSGKTKEKLNIDKAQQIAMPCKNTLYYCADNKMYVHTSNGSKIVGGLPENPVQIMIFKSSMKQEDVVLCIVDNIVYYIYPDATSQYAGVKFEQDALPSYLDINAKIIQFYSYNKKLYVYNYVEEVFEDLKNTLASDFDIK